VQAFLVSLLSVVVGGTLAGATVVGLVKSQTDPPEQSPANVSNPQIEYGSTTQ
jgi:hypothetical protein